MIKAEPGLALEVPAKYEPWSSDPPPHRFATRKVSAEEAGRSRYLGWMMTVEEKRGFWVGAVFLDPTTGRRFVEAAPKE